MRQKISILTRFLKFLDSNENIRMPWHRHKHRNRECRIRKFEDRKFKDRKFGDQIRNLGTVFGNFGIQSEFWGSETKGSEIWGSEIWGF